MGIWFPMRRQKPQGCWRNSSNSRIAPKLNSICYDNDRTIFSVQVDIKYNQTLLIPSSNTHSLKTCETTHLSQFNNFFCKQFQNLEVFAFLVINKDTVDSNDTGSQRYNTHWYANPNLVLQFVASRNTTISELYLGICTMKFWTSLDP